jgi:hypothetical protein
MRQTGNGPVKLCGTVAASRRLITELDDLFDAGMIYSSRFAPDGGKIWSERATTTV